MSCIDEVGEGCFYLGQDSNCDFGAAIWLLLGTPCW